MSPFEELFQGNILTGEKGNYKWRGNESERSRHQEEEGKITKTLRWSDKDEDIPAEEGGHTVGQPFAETDGTYGRN